MVLGDALRPLLIGLTVGLGAALLLARLLTGLLYETRPDDPISYLAAALVLLLAGIAACGHPAIKAAAADPVRALRTE
jgi:ABC-type antimicrobial peptide transport system permease subunit